MTTPAQLRAARALLGLTQPQVADAAGVSTMTLKRAEGSGNPAASADAVAAIKAALEEAGVTFSENGVTQGTRRVLPPEFLVRTLAFIDEINAEVAKTGDKIDTGELRIQTQNLGLFLWGMSLEVISEDGQDKLVLAVH